MNSPAQARYVPDSQPQSVAQLYGGLYAEHRLRWSIDAALRALNGNSDRVERLLARIFPGRTHNDRQFCAKILRHMFGLRKVRNMVTAEPLHPEFPYAAGCRAMSMRELHALLKRKYPQAHPSYDQLRRIFDGLKRIGLLTNIEHVRRDEQGKFTEESSYQFNHSRWVQLWEEVAKPTPMVRARRRQTDRADGLGGARSRSLRDEYLPTEQEVAESKAVPANAPTQPCVCGGKPCGEPAHTGVWNKGTPAAEPGEVEDSQGGVVVGGGVDSGATEKEIGSASRADRAEARPLSSDIIYVN